MVKVKKGERRRKKAVLRCLVTAGGGCLCMDCADRFTCLKLGRAFGNGKGKRNDKFLGV